MSQRIELLDFECSGLRVASCWTKMLPKKEREQKLHGAMMVSFILDFAAAIELRDLYSRFSGASVRCGFSRYFITASVRQRTCSFS